VALAAVAGTALATATARRAGVADLVGPAFGCGDSLLGIPCQYPRSLMMLFADTFAGCGPTACASCTGLDETDAIWNPAAETGAAGPGAAASGCAPDFTTAEGAWKLSDLTGLDGGIGTAATRSDALGAGFQSACATATVRRSSEAERLASCPFAITRASCASGMRGQ
jgi:hypothetical protein